MQNWFNDIRYFVNNWPGAVRIAVILVLFAAAIYCFLISFKKHWNKTGKINVVHLILFVLFLLIGVFIATC